MRGRTLLLLGAPGSGKSSLVASLAATDIRTKSFGVRRQAFRAMALRSPIGVQIGELTGWGAQSKGVLLPLSIVHNLFADYLKTTYHDELLFIEGFPINAEQVDILVQELARTSRAIDLIIVLDCRSEVLLRRIASRKSCYRCIESGKIEPLYPPNIENCPSCGSTLAIRFDDEPKWATERIQRFERSVDFILSHFPDVPIYRIDASRSLEAVHGDFVQIMDVYCDMLDRLKKIKMIAFDIDDTVVATFGVGWSKLHAACKALGAAPITKEDYTQGYGSLNFEQCIARWFPTLDPAAVMTSYMEAAAMFPYRPLVNLAEIVAYLRSQNLLCGVVTNGPREKTALKLLAAGVEINCLDLVVCAEMLKLPKPSPEGLFTLLSVLNIRNEALLYVGDAITDREASQRAGIAFIAVDTGPQDWACVSLDSRPLVIPNLNTLKHLFAKVKDWPKFPDAPQ